MVVVSSFNNLKSIWPNNMDWTDKDVFDFDKDKAFGGINVEKVTNFNLQQEAIKSRWPQPKQCYKFTHHS